MAASPSGQGTKTESEQAGSTASSGETGMIGRLFQQQAPDVKQEMADQYFATLKSAYRLLEPNASKSKSAANAEQALKKILSADPAKRDWSSANQAEQLLIELYDDERLRTELLRRVDEAKRLGLAAVPFYEGRIKDEELDKPGDAPPEKAELMRTLLARLTDDLQWFYKQRHLRRDLARAAARRVTWLFLFSLAVFIALLIAIDSKKTSQAGQPSAGNGAATGAPGKAGGGPEGKAGKE